MKTSMVFKLELNYTNVSIVILVFLLVCLNAWLENDIVILITFLQ